MLASLNPVAINQARLLNLVQNAYRLEQLTYPEHDASIQIRTPKPSASAAVSTDW